MPRNLSLKKSQQSLSQKNQKSITQFFKNDIKQSKSAAFSQSDYQKPAEVVHSSSASSIQQLANKRKFSNDNKVKFDISNLDIEAQGNTVPKKGKLEYTSSTSSSPSERNVHKQNSSQSVKPTSENERDNVNKINKLSHIDKEVNIQESIENLYNNCNRSPLAPIMENGESLNSNLSSKSSPIKFEMNHVSGDCNHECNTMLDLITVNPMNIKQEILNMSPAKDNCWSPSSLKVTPKKLADLERSPSKKGSTVKALSFTDEIEVGNVFGDEWEINDIEQCYEEDLDLSVMQRCEVLKVVHHNSRIELGLKNSNNNKGTCFIEGFWVDTPLCPGDIVSVIAAKNSSSQFCVNNSSGLLVLRPDHLVSSTSVVAGVFCKRKAVLQERWRGIDSANVAMTIGIIIHELVQTALRQHICDGSQLYVEAERVIKESIQLLYDAGISEEEVRNNMKLYVPSLTDFMLTYFPDESNNNSNMQTQKDKWNGRIHKVLDIEENLCCPQLGLKGKIDATLQVTIHERKGNKQEVVPLELKSGKASLSAEHRGQLVLYGMMLSAQRKEDPTRSKQQGLLLYLKDRVELREISCGYPERRDLIMLRNQLVQSLAPGPEDVDPERFVDIEDAASLLQQRLPEPIHSERVCSKCPYLTICSLHLWHTDGPKVSETHPLFPLRDSALSHLSAQHIKYFLHWTTLLKMEERGQILASPLHTLWTDSVEKREKRGTCIANLHLKCVESSGANYLHIFQKQIQNGAQSENDRQGPQEGEYCIVSLDDRPWIAAGIIVLLNNDQVHMLLERDLSQRLKKPTAFNIDTYESYATTVQNLTNLGVLLEDSERSDRLRRLIIDKEAPEFDKKLPRDVGRLGIKLMRSLNIEQQRAVLRALEAKDYALLRGLPGTGKTQTISVLIQMLVGLKQRVLVTAHTHSAVDNVLCRLPKSIRIMRLGAKSRVAECLADRCEQLLAASCSTVEELNLMYNSMEVVGVTCLGAAHAMLARTTFDVCIVDEATQVLQSTVLRPLFAANRFVLVGDPEQLPPVVRSRAARRLGMEESLFHRLMCEEATCTLQLQYRMNQPLADVANRVAYDGQLKCAEDKVAHSKLIIDLKKMSGLLQKRPWLSIACSPEPDLAVVFLDLKEQHSDPVEDSRACSNKTEACLVLALVDSFIKGGVLPSDIGIIAPYRDQVYLLRRSLAGQSEVSTVDQFQGRDKPVILYSCTRRYGQEGKKVKEGEVLNDQRRLAVSVTRARHKLIVIGDSRALCSYEPLQRLIQACKTTLLKVEHISDVIVKYRQRTL